MTDQLSKSMGQTLRAIENNGGIVGTWLQATRAIGAKMSSCDALVTRGLLEKGRTDGTSYFLLTGKGYEWLENHNG